MWSYQVKLYEERELAVLDVMREEGGVTVNTIPSPRDISPCYYVSLSLRLHCCHPVMLSAASHPSWGFEKSETSVAMYGTTCRARW